MEEKPKIKKLSHKYYKVFPGHHTKINKIPTTKILNEVKGMNRTLKTLENIINQAGISGQFWSLEVNCESAYKDAVTIILTMMDRLKMYLSKTNACIIFTSKDFEKCQQEKRIINIIGIQGGQAIDNRLAVLRTYHKLGARYMTLTSKCNTAWATSYRILNKEIGLTHFGKQIIGEMNRMGMVIDLSNSSLIVMNQVLDMNRMPVMISNSASKQIYDYPSNVPDEILLKLKKNNGIIMIILSPLHLGYDKSKGTPIDVAINHFDHIYNLIGCEHIGIGSLTYGDGGYVFGNNTFIVLNDLLSELQTRDPMKWNEHCLKQVLQGNILRVFKDVYDFSAKSYSKPLQEWIHNFEITDVIKNCTTFVHPIWI